MCELMCSSAIFGQLYIIDWDFPQFHHSKNTKDISTALHVMQNGWCSL